MSADISELRERLAKIETTQGHHGNILEKIDKKLDGFDDRIRDAEVKGAVNGTVAGGVISLGIALIAAKIKTVSGA